MNTLPWMPLFLVPLLFAMTLIALCSLFYAWRDGVKFKAPHRERLYRCSVCGHVYMDARATELARCPRCECLNEPLRR